MRINNDLSLGKHALRFEVGWFRNEEPIGVRFVLAEKCWHSWILFQLQLLKFSISLNVAAFGWLDV